MHYEDADELIQTDLETLKALAEDLQINHEYCPKEVILKAAAEILELIANLEDAQGEIRALRATEAGLRDRLAAVEDDRAQRVPDTVCDDDLSDLAHSANQETLSFGLSHDVFLRYFKEVRRRLLASTPAQPAQQEPAKAIAYLDIGIGGYVDLGSELSPADLAAPPRGRHMLVIAGTYGIDGYKPVAHQEPPQPVECKPMEDPCPGCTKGHVCRTPKCGRLALPVDHPLRRTTPSIKE